MTILNLFSSSWHPKGKCLDRFRCTECIQFQPLNKEKQKGKTKVPKGLFLVVFWAFQHKVRTNGWNDFGSNQVAERKELHHNIKPSRIAYFVLSNFGIEGETELNLKWRIQPQGLSSETPNGTQPQFQTFSTNWKRRFQNTIIWASPLIERERVFLCFSPLFRSFRLGSLSCSIGHVRGSSLSLPQILRAVGRSVFILAFRLSDKQL